MKKLYTLPEYYLPHDKNARKSLKRKRKKRERQKKINIARNDFFKEYRKTHYPHVQYKKEKTIIDAPPDFSYKNNAEVVSEFFNTIENEVRKNHLIELNLADITSISGDAVLYLVALLEVYKIKYEITRARIMGNLPRDPVCRDLILESGFFKFAKLVGSKHEYTNQDFLSIEHGNKAKGKIAQEVIKFANKKLSVKDKKANKAIYRTLIECMANTKNHAYTKEKDYRKWYLMALYNKKEKKVHFAFLDNGEGIPNTVVKNSGEEFVRKFMDVGIKNDAGLIFSTLNGEYHRTSTNKSYRGKGLPSIYKCFNDNMIQNLVIISNFGYVNCVGNNKNLRSKFRGTLLTWDFV